MGQQFRPLISSDHGLHVSGARDIIDEVTEARRVTDRVALILRHDGVDAGVFHENNARNQRDNVNAIINHHNGQTRDIDVSVHFNSVGGGRRETGIGVEVLYRTGNRAAQVLAIKTSAAIAKASGLRDRGAKARNNLGFLTRTTGAAQDIAILIEVCFVNSVTDVELYNTHFDAICRAIAETLGGRCNLPTSVNCNSISEEILQAMVDLGVINTPDYWRSAQNVPWLDQLLTNAAAAGKLDKRIDNGVNDWAAAINILVDAKIINSPETWRGLLTDNPIEHLDQLIINIANRALDPLHRIVWAEARGEDLQGQIMVAEVVLNRHKSPRFPSGIYNVITDSGQFSPMTDGSYAAATPHANNIQAVYNALMGTTHAKDALWFNTIAVHTTSWAGRYRTPIVDHGNHRFYI